MGIFSVFSRKQGSKKHFEPDRRPNYIGTRSYTGRSRTATPLDLLREYRSVVYTCANLNAVGVSNNPLRLYKMAPSSGPSNLGKRSKWVHRHVKAVTGSDLKPGFYVEEIVNHPLIELLESANKDMDQYSIFEVTQLHLELVGYAYWFIQEDEDNNPETAWVLQPHLVKELTNERGVVKAYEYGSSTEKQTLYPDNVIRFSFPDPISPYVKGYSPLRAAIDSVDMLDRYKNHLGHLMDQPSWLASPRESLGPAESERLAGKIRNLLRRKDHGGVGVLEDSVEIKNLDTSARDMEMQSQYKLMKSEIANAFAVPIAMLETENVNRANAEASFYQHGKMAILPRCLRRDYLLTKYLCLKYGYSDLFFLSDNPVPRDELNDVKTMESRIRTGVTTINEERKTTGLSEAKWGDEPWFNTGSLPASELLKHAKENVQPSGYSINDPSRSATPNDDPNYVTGS